MLRLSVSRHSFLVPLLGIGLSSACSDEGARFEDAEAGEFRNLEDDLELHWSFEDRVGNQITDLSGNGRHGTLNGGGTFVSSPLGEAVSLDGVDDYISLTHLGLRAPSLYGGVTGDFTISARVRVDDVNKLNTLCFGCGPFSTMHVGTATYPAQVMSALFNQQTGGSLYPKSSNTLVNDEWVEVTLVVDGGVSARYYLGCEADTQLSNANIGLKDYNFSAVGYGSSSDRWFGGEIDQLRVWSRALTEADIAELCPEPPVEQGPKLHWTFEDHTGTQITDVSGNGYHGTLNGGAFVSSPNGEAISLDGVDDYVAFTGPRSPDLYGGVNGDFTISARVRVADINKHNTLCVGCGPFATWYLGDTVHGGRMSASFLNQSTNGALWANSTPAMSEDAWTEVTMVVDGGVSVRHYFNCGFDSQVSNTNIGLKNTNFSALGSSANAARWFGGEVDELRVWDRKLSEQEVALLCDSCLGTIHVDVDAASGGDGKSWATAFNNLQDAIDASLGCESPQIWVAEGTYAPDPNAPVATITAPVAIYGGFAGTETSLDQRDFVAHPVQLGAPGWQSRVVVIEEMDVTPHVRLDGFTITGSQGGAILADGSYEDLSMELLFHNLVITNNSAAEGAGILVPHFLLFEVESSHFEGNAATVGSAISFWDASLTIGNSTFVDNLGPGAALHDVLGELSDSSRLTVSNSTLTGNIGGAIHSNDVTVTNTVFSNNTAERGAAIYTLNRGLEAHDCTFSGNQAAYGGAIYLDDDYNFPETFEIYDSSFSGNTAKIGGALFFRGGSDLMYTDRLRVESSEFSNNTSTNGGGGAIRLGGGQATLDGISFMNNGATGGGGGAVLITWTEDPVAIVGATFVDNSAPYGGAMQVDEHVLELELRDSRFISNDAVGSTGGAVRNLALGTHVINTELVGNTAASHGGGFYGRATLESTTFANNVAGGVGHGLFAPGGPTMTIRNVVAWPDNLSAASMILDHACIPQVTQTHTNVDSTFIAASPFASADLDMDGLTEFYLAPESACVDIGGTVDAFDWSVLTTQASQCTDALLVDAGVHYAPLSAVGPCEGG